MVFRADAVPYLFEREGTNCENLPETHAYLKKMRKFLDTNYPGRILLCEVTSGPRMSAHILAIAMIPHGFSLPLMPRIFMALKQRTKLHWNGYLPVPKNPCGLPMVCFLAIMTMLTLEMVTEEERSDVAGICPGSHMRLEPGIRRRLAPLLDNDRRKIEAGKLVLFSMPGLPSSTMGMRLGMGDNIWLFDRNGVRTPCSGKNSPPPASHPLPQIALCAGNF